MLFCCQSGDDESLSKRTGNCLDNVTEMYIIIAACYLKRGARCTEIHTETHTEGTYIVPLVRTFLY